VTILVQDRKYRLLSRGVVGLPKAERELEPRLSGLVERNVASQVRGSQSEFAVGQRAGGQRGSIDQPTDREATRDKEQGGQLDGQPELERPDAPAHSLVSERM
jgi:hypothetical protein